MVKGGGGIGGFGGGGLEHPRQWLGVPSCQGPPGAQRGGAGAELGCCQGATLAVLLQRRAFASHLARHAGHDQGDLEGQPLLQAGPGDGAEGLRQRDAVQLEDHRCRCCCCVRLLARDECESGACSAKFPCMPRDTATLLVLATLPLLVQTKANLRSIGVAVSRQRGVPMRIAWLLATAACAAAYRAPLPRPSAPRVSSGAPRASRVRLCEEAAGRGAPLRRV